VVLDGDPKLSARARTAISADPTAVQVSAATAWELATKARIGKLPQALDVAADVAGCLAREGFHPLSVTSSMVSGRARCPGRCAIRSTAC
jgi:PIN domain nuclease of toxin-antitoxin system